MQAQSTGCRRCGVPLTSENKAPRRRLCRSCVSPDVVERRRAVTSTPEGLRRFKQTPSYRYNTARQRARAREEYDAWVAQPCHYCGVGADAEYGVGLDRVTQTLGYEPVNVLPCCAVCNSVRNATFRVSEMEELGRVVAAIRQRRKERGEEPPRFRTRV